MNCNLRYHVSRDDKGCLALIGGFMRFSSSTIVFALLIGATCGTSRADLVFYTGSGKIMPDENLEFNDTGLADYMQTIEGLTNQTGAIYEIMSNDPTEIIFSPSAGQARVEAEDGAFSSIMIFPQNNVGSFTELEFDVNILNGTSGTFELTVVDQDNVSHSSTFDGNNALGTGSNWFSVEATNQMSIIKATLTATSNDAVNFPQIIQDVRQIRLGGVVVPEPSSFLLLGFLGTGIAGSWCFRKFWV
jgi:hypothetical protein